VIRFSFAEHPECSFSQMPGDVSDSDEMSLAMGCALILADDLGASELESVQVGLQMIQL